MLSMMSHLLSAAVDGMQQRLTDAQKKAERFKVCSALCLLFYHLFTELISAYS